MIRKMTREMGMKKDLGEKKIRLVLFSILTLLRSDIMTEVS